MFIGMPVVCKRTSLLKKNFYFIGYLKAVSPSFKITFKEGGKESFNEYYIYATRNFTWYHLQIFHCWPNLMNDCNMYTQICELQAPSLDNWLYNINFTLHLLFVSWCKCETCSTEHKNVSNSRWKANFFLITDKKSL